MTNTTRCPASQFDLTYLQPMQCLSKLLGVCCIVNGQKEVYYLYIKTLQWNFNYVCKKMIGHNDVFFMIWNAPVWIASFFGMEFHSFNNNKITLHIYVQYWFVQSFEQKPLSSFSLCYYYHLISNTVVNIFFYQKTNIEDRQGDSYIPLSFGGLK